MSNINKPDNNNQNINPPASAPVSTWVTVNTSTSQNVTSMEISKSNDYDKIINKTRTIR